MTKITLAIFLAFLSFAAGAQSKGNDFAMFAECANAESPSDCTIEKFERDITNLISGAITADLEKSLEKNYFSLSLAFISDENGKVTPETLEIACDNQQLKDAIKQYILNLPPFIPKDKSNEERRTVHMKSFTFIYNDLLKKFESASKERLLAERIKPDYIRLIKDPACAGCESDDREVAYKCTSKKIHEIISKKIDTNKAGNFRGQIRMIATFIVEKDGSVTVHEITSNIENKGIIRELRRTLAKLPDFVPGSFRDIPVRASFNLPVTINLN